ncbi:MAG: hydrogenase maturation protease [Candidatus Thermoplasmatota archaeon]|nr:hydrogenase maturation protease [Candidatus Thermoplasmatota archaeon]MDI6887944.1 hydrogenase maturation protease [Candidatus Thermoplasmatota archaeon]
MKLLLLGIGNPIRGDDCVGIEIARRIKSKISETAGFEIEFKEVCTTTLDLLSRISNYDKVVIIDAVKTGKRKVGSIYRLSPKELNEPQRYSIHNFNLSSTLKLGEKLGLKIPEIVIYGIEVKETGLKEGLSKAVEKAFPKAVSKIMTELLKC